MHMLRIFGLDGLKEEQARHPEFSHNIPEFIILQESQRHTFSIPLDSLKGCTDIPGKRLTALPDDVLSSNPAISQSRSEEIPAELFSNNLGFG